MSGRGEVTVHIDAPPDRVYALVADVTRMGEWSPECYRCEWVDGAAGAVPGARFKGWNRNGVLRWSTTAEVDAADPGREFAFATRVRGRVSTRWRYRMAPADGGTDITEAYEAVYEPLYVRLAEKTVMRGREGQLEDGMRCTLERIKAVAEAS